MKLNLLIAILFASIIRASSDTALVKRDLVSDILKAIESAADCGACAGLLGLLKGVALLGDDFFVSIITGVCVAAGIEDKDVCEGAIGLEGPILANDLRQMNIPSRTQELFCLTIFGLCPWPKVEPYAVSFPKPKPQKSRPAPSGNTPILVPHFSDIHVDLSYQVGANWNCTKPICCRPYSAEDEPGKTSNPAGPYGNTRCEPPTSLEDSMYAAIKKTVPELAFSIFTGDVIESFVWGVTQNEIAIDLADAAKRMDTLGQVFSTAGNHESVPVNAFTPTSVDPTGNNWLYSNLSANWHSEIGDVAASNLEKNSGSYSAMWGNSNLRIISVNTNYWHKNNFWLYQKEMERDPSGVLAWLVSELQSAEDADQRVWIIGHMPMGTADAFHDASNYYDQIIQRYEATIAATFWGHTHVDEFQLSYSDFNSRSASTASVTSFISPALAPDSGNPAFKIYAVDPITFGVLDSTTYYSNIHSPDFQSGPIWQKLYSVKESYGPLLTPPVTNSTAELTPAFWHQVTEVMEKDDTTFQAYMSRKRRGDYNNGSCTGDCKTTEICNIRAGRSENNCIPVEKGIHFKRDLEEQKFDLKDNFHGGCDGSRIARILAAAVGHRELFERVVEEKLEKRGLEEILIMAKKSR